MRFRLPFSWFDIKGSLWYRPAIMTAIAIMVSFLTIWLDHTLFREGRVQAWWLFEGGAEGARGVLSAIASTMMTVATTAFSFTLVALQLSSSQYSPRIVRNFTGDRVNQLVIGAFVATFVYALMVLRVVRSDASDRDVFVPAISVTVALVLTLICIAALIYFFHHATRTIQASVIIERAAGPAHEAVDAVASRHEEYEWRLSSEPVSRPTDLQTVGVVRHPDGGYVQSVAHDRLRGLAVEHDLFLEIRSRTGDFLLPNDIVVTIWAYARTETSHLPPGKVYEDGGDDELNGNDGDLFDQIRNTVHLGLERTVEWDAQFGLQQMVDIALRALSPGVNDPTTAIQAIDRIGELLAGLVSISGHEVAYLDDDAVLRLSQPVVSWDEYVRTALVEIRYYGASDPMVASHVLRTIGRVMPHVPPTGHDALVNAARDMAEAALAQASIESDRQMIRDARDTALRPAHS